MSDMTTVKDRFPVVDITHKPKRTQADSLKQAMKQDDPHISDTGATTVPQVVTLERAIAYYETHAEGEHNILYTMTAKWLREYLSKSMKSDEPVGVDVDKAMELLEKTRGK